jgi:hypothetical protein
MRRTAKTWRQVALSQSGLITRAQLREAGITPKQTERRIAAERWQRLAPNVIGTTTGELTDLQRLWLGVLHGGTGALIAGVHAANRAGLRNWSRDTITVLTPYREGPTMPLAGFEFPRTRRPLSGLASALDGPPTCRVEPAVLLFASRDESRRTAQGILAASVQQRLTTAAGLLLWLERLKPVRRRQMMSQWLTEIGGGAQSVAELDVRRMCKRFGLAMSLRQTKRRDAGGAVRFTDCEWRLPDGRTVVLEVDGGFHMDAENWEDDIARQRALSASDVIIVRCTARELRDQPEIVARDLIRLGVPLAA